MRSGLQTGAMLAIATLLLSACGGGGGGGGGTPPTPTPTATPIPNAAACPTSGSTPQSVAVGAASGRRSVSVGTPGGQYVPGTLAVTYASDARPDAIDTVAGRIGAAHVADLAFEQMGKRMRVLQVNPAQVDAAISQLKSASGVQSVARVSYRQRMMITSNDPYFVGFGQSAPYFESSSSPGQWDMHVINAEAAWNDVTTSLPVVGTRAPIAIVDTGVDVTHPELKGGAIVRTECFVTYPTSAVQTTSAFVTDTDGHGTDVAGIAAGDTGNGLGFASASYDAKIMAYRIFPSDPAGGCGVTPTPQQCFSSSADEASAINDAVANGAKVINLSLGGAQQSGGGCSTTDPEYVAVEYAIAHNVVVVAAAGNGDSNGVGQAALDCPAVDPGVIAVGASAVDDSVPGVNAQKVASYSNYVNSHGTSNGGAFLVAPGGDPSGGSDTDNLHWIENIYSSTAVQAGTCSPDFGTTSAADCRILIAGTSQATPHVAGVAAMILAVKPGYTPQQVATALCNSAANINDTKQGCGQLDAAAAVQYAKAH